MPGGSRLVFDLSGPAKIEKAYVLDAANGQPPRLIVELAATDRAAFVKSLAKDAAADQHPVTPPATVTADASAASAGPTDTRPVVVIDPGHAGVCNGTQAPRRKAA